MAEIKSDGLENVIIEGSDSDFEKKMSLEKFNNQNNLKAIITEPTLWGHFKKFGFSLMYVAVYIFFMITEYRAIYKDKKIKNIIEN